MLRSKRYVKRVFLVKDLHIGYKVHPDRDTSYLTSHAQDIEEFLNKNSQASFQADIQMESKKTTETSNDKFG